MLQNNPRAYDSPVLNRSHYCAVAKHKSSLVLLQRDSCHVINITITCMKHEISIKLFTLTIVALNTTLHPGTTAVTLNVVSN